MDDNIPLRVMLLLMDEVFDLKEKNQWLRRNIKNLLQQLIRATYGDTINRRGHALILYYYSSQFAEVVNKNAMKLTLFFLFLQEDCGSCGLPDVTRTSCRIC